MYSLWNECEDPFFGVVNYRRNWEERFLSQLEEDTLYIPQHVTFPFSVREGLVGFITLFMIIWFSLMLMFFIIDLLVLTFVFSVLRFWYTLRCVKNE